VQIESCDVFDVVTRALATSKLEPQRLQLEITETVLLRDRTRTQEVLRKLHDLGVTITLDDFGTCFATLNYLRSFPFKKIKIDRSFVRDIPEHHDCVAIVRSVGDLARELNMRSVAEGVETAASLATVRAAGYDEAQGFYFSPPVPVRAVQRTIKQCKLRLTSVDPAPPDAKSRKQSSQRALRRS
jgi:EAL domain-containing protein (putative c-di-GMP-specific phosphodiesterase class I)